MAFGKNSRMDNRKSSSYCSTVTIVVFVALCLVGVWMMTSSSVVPVENVDLSSHEESKTEMKQQVIETESRQFEDNPGDLPEDAMKGDTDNNNSQDEGNSDVQENEKVSEQTNETNAEENPEEKTQPGESKADDGVSNSEGGEKSDESEKKSETEKKSESEDSNEANQDNKTDGQIEEKKEENQENQSKNQVSNEVFPDGAQSEILNETTTQNGAWSTQAVESKNEKESQQQSSGIKEGGGYGYNWKVCNVTAGSDYIPCLDNLQTIRKLPSTKHYEHRERHCPEEAPTCLVSLPKGYRRPIEWPTSREKIWYYNVPHTKLAEVKGHQNWVKVSGEYLTFPGGGTQFKNGALHYIEFIEKGLSDIAWGKRSRVVLDVGCGVASFGGFLFDKDVLTMSFAPKDEHEAQVQFALERGIPGISAVMGTKRLPFPGRVFDVVHCARCRVPWHVEGGKLLLELNRVLRPSGHFVWSTTLVYRKGKEDSMIWKEMAELTKKLCWELVEIKNDTVNEVGAAIFRKPLSNECYEKRPANKPQLCRESDDPNAA